jgi:hypothetical protein
MQPFYRFDWTRGNRTRPRTRSRLGGESEPGEFPIARCRYKTHAADFDSILTQNWFIGSIRSYDLPIARSRSKLAFMSISFAAACFALMAAVLHFVSYKLRKTAERKAFHAKDAA